MTAVGAAALVEAGTVTGAAAPVAAGGVQMVDVEVVVDLTIVRSADVLPVMMWMVFLFRGWPQQ